jgi:hypothetical protein
MSSGGHLMIAASLAVLGLPVERYLTTTDRDEQLVLAALGRSAFKLLDTLQRNQATHIANAMVKARL